MGTNLTNWPTYNHTTLQQAPDIIWSQAIPFQDLKSTRESDTSRYGIYRGVSSSLPETHPHDMIFKNPNSHLFRLCTLSTLIFFNTLKFLIHSRPFCWFSKITAFSSTPAQILKQDPNGISHILSELRVVKYLFLQNGGPVLLQFDFLIHQSFFFFSGLQCYGRNVIWFSTEVIKPLSLYTSPEGFCDGKCLLNDQFSLFLLKPQCHHRVKVSTTWCIRLKWRCGEKPDGGDKTEGTSGVVSERKLEKR